MATVDHNTGNHRLNLRWLNALKAHGANMYVVDPTRITRSALDLALLSTDGILLSGGDINIHPSHYGEAEMHESAVWGKEVPNVCYSEDRFKVAEYLIHRSLELDMPILGVCLGSQEMNVVMEGKLKRIYGHVTEHIMDLERWDQPWHFIKVQKGGLLAGIFGDAVNFIPENSAHSFGITPRRLAPSFRVEAMSGDGHKIVEAFSLPNHRFFLGTAFHPETKAISFNLQIMEAFVSQSDFFREERLTHVLDMAAWGSAMQIAAE